MRAKKENKTPQIYPCKDNCCLVYSKGVLCGVTDEPLPRARVLLFGFIHSRPPPVSLSLSIGDNGRNSEHLPLCGGLYALNSQLLIKPTKKWVLSGLWMAAYIFWEQWHHCSHISTNPCARQAQDMPCVKCRKKEQWWTSVIRDYIFSWYSGVHDTLIYTISLNYEPSNFCPFSYCFCINLYTIYLLSKSQKAQSFQ